jgi:HlyD family secretion protein
MKILKVVLVLAALGAVGVAVARSNGFGEKPGEYTLVPVERGDLVDKALATGAIKPIQEFQIKSQISGIVSKIYVEVGDEVAAGDPLFALTPDPTPLARTEAERSLEAANVTLTRTAADLERARSLHAGGVLAADRLDAAQEAYDQARIGVQLANEKLQLLRDGRIVKARGGVDSIIRAPAAGTVLERLVDVGDPVVPLTTFQAGTPLASLADMHSLRFEGTVDEIDVGRLAVGQVARLEIGALPGAEILGRLTRIAPKAKEVEGSTLFEVEVAIEEAGDHQLRAGYSANASVVIEERVGVLRLPERLLKFEGEQAWVEVPSSDPAAEPERRDLTLGLSDGLDVEVAEGLAEGDQVVERAPKKIAA